MSDEVQLEAYSSVNDFLASTAGRPKVQVEKSSNAAGDCWMN